MSADPPLAGAVAEAETVAEATVLEFPDRRRGRRTWLIAALLVLVLVGGLLAAVIFSPLLAVRSISIEGTRLAPERSVSKALEPLLGRPLPQVDTGQVRALLADFAPIRDVDVEARPPSTLVVRVTERIPVAVLQNGRQFVLIDSVGTQLRVVGSRRAVRLPLIDGGRAAVRREVFSSITSVLETLPAAVLARLEHASARTVDSVVLRLSDGRTVMWGNASENELKARVLAALLAAPKRKDPVRIIDVSTPDRPVTR